MFLAKIKDFFKNNKKAFYYFGMFLVFYYMSTELGFATSHNPSNNTSTKDSAVEIINWIIAWLSVIVWALTYFITLFLEPGWINWSIFWLTEKFRGIWLLVSNIVYFIFAWIIIWIAFMNILGKWDKWELKTALPKFIIWVLIVPFSWFFIQFILTISAFLTVSSLTLPSDTFDDHKRIMDDIKIKTGCVVNLNYNNKTSKTFIGPPDPNAGKFFYCTWEKVNLSETLKSSTFWLISIYTYWILSLEKLSDISKPELDKKTIQNIWDLIIKVVFNFLFVIVYMLLLVTLWIVLAVRWIYLWIYIMISPIFWLMYFFDKGEWWWDSVLSKFNVKQFISLALIPVYVTLALSFWLLFIQTIWNWIIKQQKNDEKIVITPSDAIKNWADKITIAGFTLEVKWPVWNPDEDKSNMLNIIATGWNWVLWTIWTLILYFMWIAVFRISIMAAMRTSEVTKAITEPIFNFGNQVWSLIAKSPQYAPMIPWLPSMKWMEKIWSMPINALEQKASNRVWWYQQWINKMFWANSVDIAKKWIIEGRLRNWIDDEKELIAVQKEIKELINKHWTDNSVVRELMASFAAKAVEREIPGINSEKANIDKLFANWVLSKEWYGLLHIEKLSDSVTQFNTTDATNYASDHKNEWGKDTVNQTLIKWTWDNYYKEITTEQYNANNATANDELKIKIEKEKGVKYGEWKILTLNENWNWWKEITVKFENTKKDAENMTWNDLDELKELSWKLWDRKKLLVVLKGLLFENPTQIVESLEKVIKDEK